ncbi:MAG: transglutaminase domain-containing protein [Coriobacteriia bacterium]|nr:transglutaminase domain-containing protein [Coriobacteriia bacterium]
MFASKCFLRWVLIVILALVGAFLLTSCGRNAELSSEVSVDDDKRANPGQPRDNTPQVRIAEQPGELVATDWETAVLDFSNAAYGYICAASYLGDTKVKVLVDAPDGNRYQYTLPYSGYYTTIPLSRGNGTYEVGLYEHLYDNQYAALFSQSVEVELIDEFGPFLYPNQIVEFEEGDAAVQLSVRVTENATSDVEAVDQIYMWVVQNIVYDYEKAATVAPGYVPNNNNTLSTGDGICYDFATLTAAMLRVQRLPTKVEVGYCGDAYHAWISVYTTDAGWIRREIEFPGNAYVRLDPTFDSAGKGQGDVSQIIGDGQNYHPLLYY